MKEEGSVAYLFLKLEFAESSRSYKHRTAEQKQKGSQIRTLRTGPVSALAQIKREGSENRALSTARTPTAWLPFSVVDCSTRPVALSHNSTVHLLIHLSGSFVVCVHVRVSTPVLVGLTKNGGLFLSNGVCTGTDREGIPLKSKSHH